MKVNNSNNSNWFVLVGITIVAMIVVSVVTATITGNIVKVNSAKLGKSYEVYKTSETYSKAEIDKLINNGQGIINTIASSCGVVREGASSNCTDVCQRTNKKCLFGEALIGAIQNPGQGKGEGDESWIATIVGCSSKDIEELSNSFGSDKELSIIDIDLSCMCCK